MNDRQSGFTLIEIMAVVLIIGLAALLPDDAGRRGFVRDASALDDGWMGRFEYENPGRRNRGTYDLWSRGKDGVDGGEGLDADIVNWSESG